MVVPDTTQQPRPIRPFQHFHERVREIVLVRPSSPPGGARESAAAAAAAASTAPSASTASTAADAAPDPPAPPRPRPAIPPDEDAAQPDGRQRGTPRRGGRRLPRLVDGVEGGLVAEEDLDDAVEDLRLARALLQGWWGAASICAKDCGCGCG